MNAKIKRYFQLPSWTLIAFASIVFVLSVFTVRYSNAYVNWVRASAAYEQWHNSEERKICEAFEKSCLAEYKAHHPPANKTKIDSASDPYGAPLIKDLYYDPADRINQTAEYQACIAEKSAQRTQCLFYYDDPGSVSQYFADQYYFGEQLAQFLSIFLAPLYLFFCVQRFYAINHLGWQRITLVSASLLSFLFFYEIYYDTYAKRELIQVLIASTILFLALLFVPVVLRTFYVWISDGFKPQGSDRLPMTADQIPDESKEILRLTWTTAFPILKYAAIGLAVSLLLVVRPESTLKTFVAVLVQGLILIAAISIYRRFKRS